MQDQKEHQPTTTRKAGNRRRTYIINPKVQWKYAGTMMAYVFVGVGTGYAFDKE